MKSLQNLSDEALMQLGREAVRGPDAPDAWIQAAIDLGPAAARATAPQGALAEEIRETAQAAYRWVSAALSFDSWATPAVAMGMRGSATDTRHLLFCAEGCDIDLRIMPAAEAYTISGQILGSRESGQIEFTATEVGVRGIFSGARVAPLDDMGEFHLDGVAAGTYRLTLKVGRDKIALPPIDIGARQRRA
jgi:hypothetical protein